MDKEVIQVAAHLLCRLQDGIEVDVLPFRERREKFGNHAHLYLTGNAQLTLDALLADRRLLQLLHVFRQLALHIFERIAQLSHLIVIRARRQRCLEVSSRNLPGSLCKA